MSIISLLFSPNGRVTRLTYWVFMLSYNLLYFFILFLDRTLSDSPEALTLKCIALIVMLVGIIPSFMISIKRCHDLDRSGWFVLLTFVPLLNLWYLFEVGFLGGTVGTNQYGPDPLRPKDDPSLPAEESEALYDFGPYTDMENDPYRTDSASQPNDDSYDEFLTSAEDQSSQNEILGMSPVEIIVLGILLVVICSFGSFVGLKFLLGKASEPADAAVVVYQPTATSVPTAVPSPTAPPLVKSTPIPGWSQFTFVDNKAEIWLPSSYQGGDTKAYPEIVEMTLETFLSDDGFIESAKEMIADPDVYFFAFDTQPTEVTPFMVVVRETLPANIEFTMDAYLDATFEQIKESQPDIENTSRYITSLDYYSDVGVLLLEYSVPVEEGISLSIKESLHAIMIENEVWVILFLTGGADFEAYFPTIENSVRSFYIEP